MDNLTCQVQNETGSSIDFTFRDANFFCFATLTVNTNVNVKSICETPSFYLKDPRSYLRWKDRDLRLPERFHYNGPSFPGLRQAAQLLHQRRFHWNYYFRTGAGILELNGNVSVSTHRDAQSSRKFSLRNPMEKKQEFGHSGHF